MLSRVTQAAMLGQRRRLSLEFVCLLLKHGADIDAKDDEGKTAFHFASSVGFQAVATLLSDLSESEEWRSLNAKRSQASLQVP
ncbi:hypothetical protein BJV78DRAFT_1245829 [Lactifluus subvellereus]|nr:hypothetical protein BJV78DRAFT_1245829 [Lactifluus subvellereus]